MKTKIVVFIAFNIAAVFVIARTSSYVSSIILVASLFLANILLLVVFRRWPSPRADLTSRALPLRDWTSWTAYVPVIGGIVCIFVALVELRWEPCVIGALAIAIGLWRIWARGRVRRALRDER